MRITRLAKTAMQWSIALAITLVVTLVSVPLFSQYTSASVAMLYLLGALLAGLYVGRGPAIATALTGSLAFNFFLTSPRWTLRIDSLTDTVTFFALLFAGIAVAELSARVREQGQIARAREARASLLRRYTESLLSADSEQTVVLATRSFLSETLNADVEFLLTASVVEMEDSRCWRVPVIIGDRTVGVLRIARAESGQKHSIDEARLVEDCLRPLALAIERLIFAHRAQQETLRAQTESLKSTLLSGLSHDLRTPLATLLAASTALMVDLDRLPESSRVLLRTIGDETDRLTRLVGNLLEMARLSGGVIEAQSEWVPIDEMVGSIRRRSSISLHHRTLVIHVGAGCTMAFVDPLLFEQLLLNLIENAATHSQSDEPIEMNWTLAGGDGQRLQVTVSDRGIGIPDEWKTRIFDPFERGPASNNVRGQGIGLALCKAIAMLHRGQITVGDQIGGGAVFSVCVPQPLEAPPALPPEVTS